VKVLNTALPEESATMQERGVAREESEAEKQKRAYGRAGEMGIEKVCNTSSEGTQEHGLFAGYTKRNCNEK